MKMETPKENLFDAIVIGMGYVGLTFSLFMADLGFKVLGIEKNLKVVDKLRRCETEVTDQGLPAILMKAVNQGNLILNSEIGTNPNGNVFVVTVGTPIGNDKTLKSQIADVLDYLTTIIEDNDLVVLRSTVKIGTSRQFYRELKEKSDKDFLLAMCPERTIEGRALEELRDLPQIISGIDLKSLKRANEFFSSLGISSVPVESTDTAEFIKLISNTYRDINFAFANEIAMMATNFEIDAWTAIGQANEGYPRSQIQLPGLTGGPCLEKDPYILAESLGKFDKRVLLSLVSREVNNYVPFHAVKRVINHPAYSSRIRQNYLVVGIAFKGRPETADTRGSLAYVLAKAIKHFCPDGKLFGWDYLVSSDSTFDMVEGLSKALSEADVIFIQNNNSRLLQEFKKEAKEFIKGGTLVFDFWNVLKSDDLPLDVILISHGKGYLRD
jgi:UDP-N-acetyl-D-mannosaminuronic acid dehydrogenase